MANLTAWYVFDGYTMDCDECGTLLSYNEYNSHLNTVTDFEIEEDYVVMICPKCGHHQKDDITSSKIDYE